MEKGKLPEWFLHGIEAAILVDEDAPDFVKASVRFGPMVRALQEKICEFYDVSKAKVEAEDAAWFEEAREYFALVIAGMDQFLAQSRGTP